MLGLLQENEFLHLLAKGKTYKTSLVSFSRCFLDRFQLLMESDDSVYLEHEVGAPIRLAWERISRFCRALLHFFCEAAPSGVKELSDADVMFWKSYHGSEFPEKSICRIFTQEGSFWQKESMEMVEKAGSAVLLGEKIAELQAMLEKDCSTTGLTELKNMAALFGKIQECVRSQKLCAIRTRFLVSWLSPARGPRA